MRWIAAALLVWTAGAAELKPATSAAFDRYIRETEQRLDQHKGQLWADESPGRAARVRGGEVVVEPFHANALTPVVDGLVHDWVGAAFLPGVTVEQTLRFVQDYDKAKLFFKPEVVDSRLLWHEGNHYRVFMRLRKKKVITVVLDTEHDVQYERIDDARWRSASRTTRISEVDNPGGPNEKVLPPGKGEGFLWRLNSYWRFQERDGGTWIECQAVSLTRDVPTGLGWLIEPIIKNLPKDSLTNTLRGTRTALVSRAKQ
jgi:hypothetical protein